MFEDVARVNCKQKITEQHWNYKNMRLKNTYCFLNQEQFHTVLLMKNWKKRFCFIVNLIKFEFFNFILLYLHCGYI